MNANRRLKGLAFFCGISALSPAVSPLWAEVVFDGSIGSLPAGTARAGNFIITESDGQLNASNLFHSFERLNVNAGESALFTHSTDGVLNIIGRVSGDSATQIQGGVGIAQGEGANLMPTAATLWLINPNGLIISDGAAFEPNGTYRLSTANEIGFANGDSFFSHDVTSNSTLSVASPVAFGFLAGDSLPASVTPGGLSVRQSDPSNTGQPLFLANTTLVGSSVDNSTPGLTVQGSIGAPINSASPFAPEGAAQIQAFRLGLHALSAGQTVSLGNQNSAETAGGGVSISNANLLVADIGLFPFGSSLEVSAGTVAIDNSFVQTQGVLGPASLDVAATEGVLFSNSALRTTTLSNADGGSLTVAAGQIVSDTSVLSTQVAGTGFTLGAAGDIEITAGQGGIGLSGSTVSAGSTGGSASGDVVVSSLGDLLAAPGAGRATVLSASNDLGDAGQVSLSAAGELNLAGVSLNAQSTSGGAVGDIGLTGGQVLLTDTTISAATLSADATDQPAAIGVQSPGDIRVQNGSIIGNTAGAAPAGVVTVVGGGAVTISNALIQSGSTGSSTGQAGGISVTAGQALTLEGNVGQVTTTSEGSANAGDINLTGQRVDLLGGATVASLSLGAGNAGTIRIVGGEIFADAGATLSTASDNAAAGGISLVGERIALIGQPGLDGGVTLQAFSSSSEAFGNGGSITLGDAARPAQSVVVSRTAVAAFADQGDGGQININSDSFVRDNRAVLAVSSASGNPGALEINAPQQDISAAFDELQVPLLDQTELIRNDCDQSQSERSSLIVAPASTVKGDGASAPDTYFSTSRSNPKPTVVKAAGGCAR